MEDIDTTPEQSEQPQQPQSKYSEEDVKFILNSTDNGMINLYSILDVKKDSTKEQIESKYTMLCKIYKIDKLSREELQDDNFALQRSMFLAYVILGNEYLREIYDSFDFSNQTLQKNVSAPWNMKTVKQVFLDFSVFLTALVSTPMNCINIMIQSSPVVVDDRKVARYLFKNYSFTNFKEYLILFATKVGFNMITIPINRAVFGPYYTFAGLVVNYPLEMISNLMYMNIKTPLRLIIKNLNYKTMWHGLPIYLIYKVTEELLNQVADGLEIFSHKLYHNNPNTLNKCINKVCSSSLVKTLAVSAITCPIHMALIQYQSTLLYSTNAIPGAILPATLVPATLGLMHFVKNISQTQTFSKFYNGYIPYVLNKYTPAYNQ